MKTLNPEPAGPLAGLVQISPACGPAGSGVNVFMSGVGVDPGASIRWNLIDSQGQIPFNGYYQTNDTGGFNDIAFLSDLKPDNYQMNFVQGGDVNNPDIVSPKLSINLTIPCTSG
jgi:hypothetical protein